MDDGQVIPGLNENWTFAGAKPMEWACGLVSALVFSELFVANAGKSMPIILIIMVSIPMSLAMWRQCYPDEERGLRNHIMSMMGLEPPDIPRPSLLQPVWSGHPMEELKEKSEFMQLGLDLILYEERFAMLGGGAEDTDKEEYFGQL